MKEKGNTKYPFGLIMVAKQDKGPYKLARFVKFMQHGRVKIDIAMGGATPDHIDCKYWSFPVFPACVKTLGDLEYSCCPDMELIW